jgi:Pyruvate/2-oxoacid:ferredoxin oxidoreductase gamma subunit
MTTDTKPLDPELQELDRVTIRFAGDSGDGMQLTGTQFTRTAAVYGNDISTLPDFPAEIRAPAGSLPGVSGFQISFSSSDIHTPGDQPDVLVAMNPAALKTNVGDLPAGGALIVNSDAFTAQNLNKAGYASNPLTDESLKQFALFEIPISTLNERALDGLDMTSKQKDLTKNFFALGIMFWLYGRDSDATIRWIDDKFGKRPVIAEANKRALKAGYAFGETTEIFHTHYRVAPRGTAVVLRVLPDHAGFRHPPPAVRLQELRREDVPGGGRDRGDRRRDRGELWRGDGPDGIVGAGDRPEERGAGPRDHGRAPARRHRRPARRSVDGHADQDGAGRPAPGPLRSEQRFTAPRGRPGDARGVLRPRDRGVAAGAEVRDPGRLPLGRVPRDRR